MNRGVETIRWAPAAPLLLDPVYESLLPLMSGRSAPRMKRTGDWRRPDCAQSTHPPGFPRETSRPRLDRVRSDNRIVIPDPSSR